MADLRFEAVVEHGVIQLMDQVNLPDKTKVYVVVPADVQQALRFPNPRLVHSDQASQFSMEVIGDGSTVGI